MFRKIFDTVSLTVQGKVLSIETIQADPSLVQQMTPDERSKYTDYINRMYDI